MYSKEFFLRELAKVNHISPGGVVWTDPETNIDYRAGDLIREISDSTPIGNLYCDEVVKAMFSGKK